MGIETRAEGRTLHITVDGALDGPAAEAVRQEILGGAEGADAVVVDLAGVSWINSSGLGHLTAAYVSLQNGGKSLRLVGVNPRVLALLEASKLTALLG